MQTYFWCFGGNEEWTDEIEMQFVQERGKSL